MLLYSLLHLTGYDLPLDELRNFRQWGSLTPGHPEYGFTPGVEVTTGPLGQGFATGVGMAMAQAHLAASFKPDLFDQFIYAIVTDGDLMEGIASEAASLAAHLRLGRLIYLYDDNHISIDGSTDLAFTEDRTARFEAYGWHVQRVDDGNDVDAIDKAIQAAKSDPRPSLIACRTIIGYGSPKRQGTSKAHGEPLGDEELKAAKENLGWPVEPRFYIPDDVLGLYREAAERGRKFEDEWRLRLEAYIRLNPSLGKELDRRLSGDLPNDWDSSLPSFPADPRGMATRAASGKVLNALAAQIPELIGGSADLAPSNNTKLEGIADFQKESYAGRNFHFGVREHAMAAAVNGMALYGGVIPFGATFLVFADYMRPAIRVAAFSHIPSIFVFTHDSIGVGEDGPTHQPIEHLASLRVIPNLVTIRPADANEVTEAWKIAITRRDGPTALILTRQNLVTFERTSTPDVDKGAYVLADFGKSKPELILMASGSEVQLCVEAAKKLMEEGRSARVVSFPSWELFAKQDEAYRESVLPREVKARVAVEAGTGFGWERFAGLNGRIISIDRYGASAPAKILFEKFGFTVENVLAKARELL
jgi:transketolase